jgi:hypothetical protein
MEELFLLTQDTGFVSARRLLTRKDALHTPEATTQSYIQPAKAASISRPMSLAESALAAVRPASLVPLTGVHPNTDNIQDYKLSTGSHARMPETSPSIGSKQGEPEWLQAKRIFNMLRGKCPECIAKGVDLDTITRPAYSCCASRRNPETDELFKQFNKSRYDSRKMRQRKTVRWCFYCHIPVAVCGKRLQAFCPDTISDLCRGLIFGWQMHMIDTDQAFDIPGYLSAIPNGSVQYTHDNRIDPDCLHNLVPVPGHPRVVVPLEWLIFMCLVNRLIPVSDVHDISGF